MNELSSDCRTGRIWVSWYGRRPRSAVAVNRSSPLLADTHTLISYGTRSIRIARQGGCPRIRMTPLKAKQHTALGTKDGRLPSRWILTAKSKEKMDLVGASWRYIGSYPASIMVFADDKFNGKEIVVANFCAKCGAEVSPRQTILHRVRRTCGRRSCCGNACPASRPRQLAPAPARSRSS